MVEDAHNKLRLHLGRQPSEPELAQELRMPLPELQKLLGEIDSLEIGSLRVISRDDGKEEDLCEKVTDERESSPLAQCLNSELRDQVKSAISGLPERERRVLELYYFGELTMKEIGTLMGVGESRVSQIHSMAVLKLRAQMSESQARRGSASTRAAAAGRG